jgi:hypothetical protein
VGTGTHHIRLRSEGQDEYRKSASAAQEHPSGSQGGNLNKVKAKSREKP